MARKWADARSMSMRRGHARNAAAAETALAAVVAAEDPRAAVSGGSGNRAGRICPHSEIHSDFVVGQAPSPAPGPACAPLKGLVCLEWGWAFEPASSKSTATGSGSELGYPPPAHPPSP